MIAKEQLEELYIKQNKTATKIAKELNISISQVLDYLYKYEFKKSKIENICQNCGKKFNPPRSHPKNKYCCYECSRQAKCILENKICPTCHKEFKPRTKRDKYCSKKCSDDAKRDILKSGYYTKCLECGKEFKTIPSENAKFCCHACYERGLISGKIKFHHKCGTLEEIHGEEKAKEIRAKHRLYKPSKEAIEKSRKANIGKKRSKEVCEKLRQIQLSKEHQLKIYNTKKKNHTFNTSKPEEEIYQLLKEKFNNIERQYKSELYPFHCDFYIHELDLYIEYQGHWTHGINKYKCAYDKNDINHINFANKYRNKNIKFYDKFIQIWTIVDPLKRKIAKENNLNWIEFFTIDQFMEWYKTQ